MNADIFQFATELSYHYPIGKPSLLSKDFYFYLSPYSELFIYFNQMNFARDGIYLDFSLATWLSLGIHPSFILQIHKKLQFEGSAKLNLFSIVIRMPEIMDVNDGEKDDPRLKLLTPLNAVRG